MICAKVTVIETHLYSLCISLSLVINNNANYKLKLLRIFFLVLLICISTLYIDLQQND